MPLDPLRFLFALEITEDQRIHFVLGTYEHKLPSIHSGCFEWLKKESPHTSTALSDFVRTVGHTMNFDSAVGLPIINRVHAVQSAIDLDHLNGYERNARILRAKLKR